MMSQEPAAEYDGLRQEIEQTRAELGETVEALAAKADVKTRAQQMADDARSRVRETATETVEKALHTATNGLDAAKKATRTAKMMLNRPRVWVFAALAGIGVVSAVIARRRPVPGWRRR